MSCYSLSVFLILFSCFGIIVFSYLFFNFKHNWSFLVPSYILTFRKSSSSSKMTVFWDAAPCSLVEIERCFRGQFLWDYTAQHPGRQSSSYLLLWELDLTKFWLLLWTYSGKFKTKKNITWKYIWWFVTWTSEGILCHTWPQIQEIMLQCSVGLDKMILKVWVYIGSGRMSYD
jgi:hypothetical protein